MSEGGDGGDRKMKQGGESSGSGKGGATFFPSTVSSSFFFSFFTFLSWSYKVLQARYLPSPSAYHSPLSKYPRPLFGCRSQLIPVFLPPSVLVASLSLSLFFFFFPVPFPIYFFFPLVLSFTACGSGILQAQARRLLLLGASDRLFLTTGAAAKPPPNPTLPRTPFPSSSVPSPRFSFVIAASYLARRLPPSGVPSLSLSHTRQSDGSRSWCGFRGAFAPREVTLYFGRKTERGFLLCFAADARGICGLRRVGGVERPRKAGCLFRTLH